MENPQRSYLFTSKPGDTTPVRILIIAGLLFMGAFLWIFLQPENRGNSWLYWLLAFSVGFKLLRMLHEWYHYWKVVPIAAPVSNKTWKVDILTTFCKGEPYEMIVNTLKACQAIRYPHTTYLCDEADDPYLKQVCAELGVRHVTRTLKVDAKAGNINNALKQADGDICLVLDPDHIPVPDFFDHVLPYFDDPEVGYVQCVQAYYNQKESIVAYGAAEQTYHFYGPMMTCMGQYNTAQAIGANCTFRREALDSIGGHAAGLSEDMHTAMRIHAKGWKSIYVPKPLSYGLVPSTLAAFYKQQLKWARGTFELLFEVFPKLAKDFSWRQRLHYFTLPFHYFFGLIRLIDILIPILSLVLLQLPMKMDLTYFGVAFVPMFLTSLLIRQYAQRWLIEKHEAGFHLIGGILNAGTWWIYTLGFVYSIFRVKVPYLPTPKNDKPQNNFTLCLPNIIALVATLGAIAYSLYHYGRLAYMDVFFQVMMGFAGVNAIILLITILIGQEKFLLQVRQFLSWSVVRKWLVQPLQQASVNLRYGMYGSMRRYALHFFIVVIGSAAALGLYDLDRRTPISLPFDLRYGTTQPFYYGVNSQGSPAAASASIQTLQTNWDLTNGQAEADLNLTDLTGGATPMVQVNPILGPGRPAETVVRDYLKAIRAGKHDAYLAQLAKQIKAYQRPVMVSFAPEFDNPEKSWGVETDSSLEAYRKTWQYVITYLRRQDVANGIWLWNPMRAATLERFYPGSSYVDWLGLVVVNDKRMSEDGEWHSFSPLFTPLQNKLQKHAADSIQMKPVLLTRFGSRVQGVNSVEWVVESLETIRKGNPQIRGVVFEQATDARITQRTSAALPASDIDRLVQQVPPGSFLENSSKGRYVMVKYSPYEHLRKYVLLSRYKGSGKNAAKSGEAPTVISSVKPVEPHTSVPGRMDKLNPLAAHFHHQPDMTYALAAAMTPEEN